MVEPPPIPSSGDPRLIPHPIGPATDCKICHALDAVRPFPNSHANYEKTMCTLCHEPAEAEASAAIETVPVPGVPHLIAGQEDACLTCHNLEGVSPYPDNHVVWEADTCLLCHQQADVEVTAEDEERRPSIPHTLEGREDCLFCHNLDGIKPFPANHEDRTVDKCQACHKPKET